MLARPMRGLAVFATLAAVIAVVLILQSLGMFAGGELPAPPGQPEAPTTATPGASASAPSQPGRSPGPAGLVATRAEGTLPTPPANLADSPTAWLQVTDRGTGKAVAGAPIRRLQGGPEVAFTDERGLAAVALREPEQLAVVVDGYLLRLVPTRLGTTEGEPQAVLMVRDEWSIVRRLQFTSPDGKAVAEAFVRFRPRAAGKGAASPVPSSDAIAQRAWTEHMMLATRPGCADVPVQLGSFAEDRVHRLANDTDVRFVAAGEFTIEAASTTGLVARIDTRIDALPRTGAPPIRVPMVDGAFAVGSVVGLASGKPVADARLTLQGGEPLGLVATTAGDGSFRVGPLLPGRVTLLVRHGDHEPLAFGPLVVPADDVRIALQPLPQTSLRGRVRTRPTLRPLAGATVSWTPPGSAPVTATTDADGQFTLRATGNQDARLAVQAVGHLAYAELVAPGAPFADYDVWPAVTSERLAHGLSALLEGIVVDAEGRPRAGLDVRWRPARPAAAPTGVPGRRVLEGGALELPLGARTGDDGAFRIETNAFGEGRLVVADDPTGRGLAATATAGQTTHGLRLQP